MKPLPCRGSWLVNGKVRNAGIPGVQGYLVPGSSLLKLYIKNIYMFIFI